MMAMLTTIGGVLFTLLLIWSTGYVLVRAIAPNSFRPLSVELAAALLVGVCAAGVVLVVPSYLVRDPQWVIWLLYWALPIVLLVALPVALARWWWLSSVSAPRLTTQPMPLNTFTIAAHGSALVLLIGITLLLAQRPVPEPSLEFYGARVNGRYELSIISTAVQPQSFIIVAHDDLGEKPLLVAVDPVSAATGPVSLAIPAIGNVRFELYYSSDDIGQSPPLRQLAFYVPRS